VPADQRVHGFDPVDRSADRLPDRQPGPLAVVGEGPDPAAEAGGGGQVRDQPVVLAAGGAGRRAGLRLDGFPQARQPGAPSWRN